MGISIPSTQYIVELATLFKVSTDYILGIQKSATINVEGLSKKEVATIIDVIECFRENKKDD